MSIEDLIGPGIGFTPGSLEFIVTRGMGVRPWVAYGDSISLVSFRDKRSYAFF